MGSVLEQLQGQRLLRAVFDADTKEWVFSFGGELSLRIAAPWRVCRGDVIEIGWEDDGQLFGLAVPVDAHVRLGALLQGRHACTADVGRYGDLTIVFDGLSTLHVFNASSGYEGWQLYGPGAQFVVAQGGGCVAKGQFLKGT